MHSPFPQYLVTKGMVYDGKNDRDGEEGKDLGPEARNCGLWAQGHGCGTTEIK